MNKKQLEEKLKELFRNNFDMIHSITDQDDIKPIMIEEVLIEIVYEFITDNFKSIL